MNNVNSIFLGNTVNRVMAAVLGFTILLAGYFIYDIYRKNIRYTEEKILTQLNAIVRSVSLEISPRDVAYLARKFPNKDDITQSGQDTVYYRLHQFLAAQSRVHNLKSPIYLLTSDDQLQNFEFVVTSAEIPYFRHTFRQFPQILKEKYHVGGAITDYETENGRWLSAFAPVKDGNDKVIGVVQADHEFDSFLAIARENLWKNIFIAMAVIVGLSLILFKFMTTSLRREEELRYVLLDKNREIIGQNEEIRAQHEEILTQHEKISENNLALEKSKKIIEEKNTLLENTNKLLDQRVKERTKALKESMENLDSFLYRSYHDILGPIATLKGLCELSKMESQDKTSLFYFEKIDNSVDNLKQSIRKVNAVYELKNRYFISKKINLGALVKRIIEKQQYLFQLPRTPLNNFISSDCHVNTDMFFLDLLLSDIIRNILAFAQNHEIQPISFHANCTKSVDNEEITLEVHDPGSREIFLNTYFRIPEKDTISLNHDLYIFHNVLKKLKCRIVNYDNPENGQIMALRIPNLY